MMILAVFFLIVTSNRSKNINESSNPHALAGTTKHETLEKIEGRS